MKFDYSKTINEQLPTFDYYKDRYCSYELELINDRKEIERLNNIIKGLEQELIKKLEAIKTIKDTLGEGAYVLNPHIDLLEQEYNYFYNKLQELKKEVNR